MQFEIEKIPASHVYKLIIGLVTPRPIALVTSMDRDGRLNAAPFSAYNYLAIDPPIIGIGVAARSSDPARPKDTARNIGATGEFVVNIVTEDIAQQMNICGTDFPPEMNELELAGFTTAPSQVVNVPRIAEAHAALECREHTTLLIGNSRIILGRVVSMYVEDRFVDPAGPYINAEELHTVGRMNGLGSYVRTRDAFITIPRITLADWEKGKR
jgi:flavin reductase (DIM6/NTAB) family NADH-FMN oxidoreductase RutF